MNSETVRSLISICDHTNLSPKATLEDVKALVDDGIKYGASSVCIPPCYVKDAKEYADGRIKICTVIGFPLGYASSYVKAFEAQDAVICGADEIDMVINIGQLKAKNAEYVRSEIEDVRRAAAGRTVKVIIETALLTEEEKLLACRIVTDAGADYIKTSTGFSSGGATVEDVRLMRENVGENVKIKAAGGISSLEDAKALSDAGADRLGSSRLIKIAKELGL
jgi:deoxyribose-phosphate aldolase